MLKVRKLTPVRMEELLTAYVFVLPFIGLWVVWFFIPLIQAFNYSFYKFSFVRSWDDIRFLGLENYYALFHDKLFWKAAGNTFVFVLVVVPITNIISLPIACLLNDKYRGRTLFRVIYYMPDVISSIAVTTVFMYLFTRGGILSRALTVFGIPNITWYTDTRFALPFVMIIYIWQVTGFYIIIYLSGLQGISGEIYESATLDGANGLQTFFGITLPLIKPTLVFGLTMSMIGGFQVFDQIAAVSGTRALGTPAGATSNLTTFFYTQSFQYFEMGYGCAGAVVLFFLILFVSLVQKALIGKEKLD